jgi:hypothetical protein
MKASDFFGKAVFSLVIHYRLKRDRSMPDLLSISADSS